MFNSKKISIKEINYIFRKSDDPNTPHAKFSTANFSNYELIYKLSGDVLVHYGDKTVRERGGDLRFIPPSTEKDEHPDYRVDITEPAEGIIVGFTSDSELPHEMIVKSFSRNSHIKNLFIQAENLWICKKSGCYYNVMSVLYEILAEISDDKYQYADSSKFEIIKPAVDYLDEHFFENDINYNGLATMCGVSYKYMSTLFKKFMGESPNKYVLFKRIDFACELLVGRYDSIGEIAYKCGFCDEYYFSRVFKNHVGVSPSRYVEKVTKAATV